jgi:3-oxoacyl-[acyl-carrier-protein] synthase-1
MVCPVGLKAPAACAAMRGGIANFRALDYWDNAAEPIIGAFVPGLEGLKHHERLIEMLTTAVAECLMQDPDREFDGIPIFVGLSEPERPGSSSMGHSVIPTLEGKLGVRFHPTLSRLVQSGHTAVFEALVMARKLLDEARVRACLICAGDSYLSARSLNWLDQHARLKTADNSDGVIPGEAAAAILVHNKLNSADQISVEVVGLGFANESAHVLSEEPLFAHGLTAATRMALAEASIDMHLVDFRISDVTGESYGFKEQSLTLSRCMKVRRERQPLWHCSDSIGDTGAAAGACELVVGFTSFLKGYAPGPCALCFTSSVGGARASAVLRCASPRLMRGFS